jgi:hypothetical protein
VAVDIKIVFSEAKGEMEQPINGLPTKWGNGAPGFVASFPEQVRAFWEAAITMGGRMRERRNFARSIRRLLRCVLLCLKAKKL